MQLGTSVVAITPEGDGYWVELEPTPGCSSGLAVDGAPVAPHSVWARHVVVNAGAHSLLMAQRMGYVRGRLVRTRLGG